MKNNKNIFKILLLLIIFLTSCKEKTLNNHITVNNKKEDDKLNFIKYIEFFKLLDSKKTFSFAITLDDCNMCENFFKILENKKDIKIDYILKISKSDKNYRETIKQLKEKFPKLKVAPDIYYKKENKIKRFFDNFKDLNEKNLKIWLKEF